MAANVSTWVAKTFKGKGSVSTELGLASTYANDAVRLWTATADRGDGINTPVDLWEITYSVAASASALNADTTGYAKAPNGSFGLINTTTRTVVFKSLGSGYGYTDGTWA
jgi:hypothetical protein